MTRKLFELVGSDATRPFSPYVWRIRMALAHKGLDVECVPWRFKEKSAIAPYKAEKVPVLIDGDTSVVDSWAIACYLEDAYPDRPSLFGGEGGRANAKFMNAWSDINLIAGIFPLIGLDITRQLDREDADYFRVSREARIGKTLEEFVANRDKAVEGFRKGLDPMRIMLRTQPFIGGSAPNYADYIVFGPLMWARAVSNFNLLKQDDSVFAWRERLLDAHGGLARKSPGYDV